MPFSRKILHELPLLLWTYKLIKYRLKNTVLPDFVRYNVAAPYQGGLALGSGARISHKLLVFMFSLQ